MTITEMVELCFQQAIKSGWADHPVPVPEQVALICSEACEALESYRLGEQVSWTNDHKPEGIASEYADIVIRVAHYSRLLNIDLEHEITRKLAYNATRSYRHGGKKA